MENRNKKTQILNENPYDFFYSSKYSINKVLNKKLNLESQKMK